VGLSEAGVVVGVLGCLCFVRSCVFVAGGFFVF
jgi:hypothetical protein